MVKNTGGKHKHRKKSANSHKARKISLIKKDIVEGTVYGRALKSIGNRRFTVLVQQLNPNEPYQELKCLLKGSIRTWLPEGTYVRVQRWIEINSNSKGSIDTIYTDLEVTHLKKAGVWDFEEQSQANESGVVFGAVKTEQSPSPSPSCQESTNKEKPDFSYNDEDINNI